MPKIRFDLRQSILDLIDQLQREGVLDEVGGPAFVFRSIPRRYTVVIPDEIVSAIRGQIDTA